MPIRKRDIEVKEANLVRISGKIAKTLPEGFPSHENLFCMLKHYAREKGYQFGWVMFKFERLAGVKPPREWNHRAAIPPCARVKNWIVKEQQNYARRQSYGRRKAKAENAGST